ncbi:MAG TPA: L-seryl-tRNA(Sec) selenium transferase [Pyrinomonadaceae bacterium]|nr:L-seryl-tRNA(Sec) selenium transferase [Pyrinomonadaceae bacterium]
MANSATLRAEALRELPSVDQILRSAAASELRKAIGSAHFTAVARVVIEQMRADLLQEVKHESGQIASRESLLAQAISRIQNACKQEALGGLRRVINATGVIIHTNLGRAPLSGAAREAVNEAAGYCTLEYDLTTGGRGRRGKRVETLLAELTTAEAALVVNNCAAAALLILTVLAGDGETIVSRGELVEIGGDFRVPEVLASSGTKMVEVGTTNRTRLADYKRAINENTRLILRVHPSNYRIVGFTASPSLSELASLAHEAGLFFYEDAGSGALEDLGPYGLSDEPLISDSISRDADVVSFSGDKLLGSAQAGLIVGKEEVVGRLRKHPLYRALRADKLCLAALEATLDTHRRGASIQEVPALRMLSISADELANRARRLAQHISDVSKIRTRIVKGESALGGGSGPTTHPPTTLIALEHSGMSAVEIERSLRLGNPPVITRIAEGSVLLDLRTVSPDEEGELLQAINSIAS